MAVSFFNARMATNGSVTVTSASTPVITSAVRTCVITNMGTAGTVFLRVGETGDAVVNEGIPLAPASSAGLPGGSFSINGSDLHQAPVTAISSTGSNVLAVYFV